MIVDDEKMICEEFQETLEAEGHHVDYALDGSEAISKIQRNRYTLVFLDAAMPRMQGSEVLQRMRKVSRIPVAFISGFLTPRKEKEAMAYGASMCLRKPLELKRIKSLIQSVEFKRKF